MKIFDVKLKAFDEPLPVCLAEDEDSDEFLRERIEQFMRNTYVFLDTDHYAYVRVGDDIGALAGYSRKQMCNLNIAVHPSHARKNLGELLASVVLEVLFGKLGGKELRFHLSTAEGFRLFLKFGVNVQLAELRTKDIVNYSLRARLLPDSANSWWEKEGEFAAKGRSFNRKIIVNFEDEKGNKIRDRQLEVLTREGMSRRCLNFEVVPKRAANDLRADGFRRKAGSYMKIKKKVDQSIIH